MNRSLQPLKNTPQSKDKYKTWLRQAKFDLEAARLSLGNGFNEWAAYQSEQAVEKALKSILVHAGWRPPRVHKLPVLLGMCNSVNDKCKQTKFNFKHLESFTFISRYPFLIPSKDHQTPHELISHEEAQRAVLQADDFLDKVNNILSIPVEEIPVAAMADEMFTREQIDERLKEVKQILIDEFNPSKIILFGSFARNGAISRTKTMDIMIVADTDLKFIERIKRAREITQGHSPIIEPLVYTPDEFKFMVEEEGEGFIENALEEGIEIYSR